MVVLVAEPVIYGNPSWSRQVLGIRIRIVESGVHNVQLVATLCMAVVLASV